MGLVGLLLFAVAGAPYAHACDCMPLSFDEAAEQADLIAEITIVSEDGAQDHRITYVAAVERVWKGEESREIRFTTSEAIASCGLGRIPVGDTLLVWANGSGGEYSSTWCGLPSETEDDVPAQLTRELGEPADLTDQPPPEAEQGIRVPLLILGGLVVLGTVGGLLIAAIIVAVVLLRSRRSTTGRSGGP